MKRCGRVGGRAEGARPRRGGGGGRRQGQVQARALVAALEDLWRDGGRCGVARRRLGLGLQLALDDGRALAVAHRHLIQPRRLGECVLALVNGPVQLLCNLLSQDGRVGARALRQRRQRAVQRRQLVHLLHRLGVGRVEVADQRQRAHQVRGEELGVVEEVVDRRLRIRIGRRQGIVGASSASSAMVHRGECRC